MNNIKDNPFAQDSIPIGTVVEWEDCNLEVVVGEGCSGCYFEPESCMDYDRWCSSEANTDGFARKYILINEKQEEQAMGIKLEDGKKYVTEGGEVVTMKLRDNSSIHCFLGSNGFTYTEKGKLYSNGAYSTNDIVQEYIEQEGHIHAEFVIEYGKDLLTDKEAWKGWQVDDGTGWLSLLDHPSWNINNKYRRKPKTILINGYEVPEPLRVAPPKGTTVYIVHLTCPASWVCAAYGGDDSGHKDVLDKGIMHLTKEAVQLHAKAVLSFTTTVQEKQDEEV